MKSIYDMTGAERAAALLVALGPQVAADIMKHLDELSIEKLTIELAKIKSLDAEEREELIGGFMIDLRKAKRSMLDGENRARDLLISTLGEEKAEEILNKVTSADVVAEFSYFENVDSTVIYTFLEEEHPQTIAVTLNYLEPRKSGAILKMLPEETAKAVAIRLAKMDKVTPEAVAGIAKALRKRYEKYIQENRGLDDTGGVNKLVDILHHMPGEDERKIMRNLDITMPAISKKIKDRVFSFDNITSLSNYEMRLVIDEINNDQIIAKALKGAGDDIRFKFFRNMSKNRATDILNDMDIMGGIKLSEVDENRSYIVMLMRDLHDNGIISLKEDGEIYVE